MPQQLPQRFVWRQRESAEARRFRRLAGHFPPPDEAYIERCRQLLMAGDPVADELADWFDAVGWAQGHQQLNLALSQGLSALPEAPPPLAAMMHAVETTPLWLDRDLVETGARAMRRVGPLGSLALRDVALMGGYGNAAINKPLMFTGALAGGAARRATETRSFWVDVTRAGGLARDGSGFRSAIHVRMMHGVLRRRIARQPGWRSEDWGVPINQGDMLATNLAFSLVFMTVLGVMGFRFSRRERAGILHLWRYVGYLMGIDERILVTTEAEGRRYLYGVLMSQPAPDEDTRALALALMNEPLDQIGRSGWRGWWAEAHVRAHNGVSRLFLGKRGYTALGLPGDRCWPWFPLLLAPPVLATEAARRCVPGFDARLTAWAGDLQVSWLAARLRDQPAQYRPVETLRRSA